MLSRPRPPEAPLGFCVFGKEPTSVLPTHSSPSLQLVGLLRCSLLPAHTSVSHITPRLAGTHPRSLAPPRSQTDLPTSLSLPFWPCHRASSLTLIHPFSWLFCVCAHVPGCVCSDAHAHACVWKAEVNAGCLPQLLTFFKKIFYVHLYVSTM